MYVLLRAYCPVIYFAPATVCSVVAQAGIVTESEKENHALCSHFTHFWDITLSFWFQLAVLVSKFKVSFGKPKVYIFLMEIQIENQSAFYLPCKIWE